MRKTTIDWAPIIPNSWETVRLKDIARLQSGNSITSDDIDDVGDYPVYGGNGLRGYTDTFTNDGEYVLIGRQGALCGNINYARNKFFASEHAVVVYPFEKHESIVWLGKTLEAANLNKLSASAAQPGLAVSTLNFVKIPYPPKDERERIGRYLNAKTGEIDERIGLLEKKRELQVRLKKAIINQTVTRGLDKNVKLKDSGVEWIGMIPEHWEVKRFKDVFRKYSTGFTPESKNIDNFSDNEEFTWVTIADMTTRVVGKSNLNLSQKAIEENLPVLTLKGSLMFSFKLTIGKTAFAEKDLYTNEAIVSIPPHRNVDLNYFYYFIPMICMNNTTENIYGAKMLNQRIIANMFFSLPPYEEQQAIAAYLDEKSAKIDTAIANIDKQIDALKRLKRALINEVITGQRAI